MDYGWMPHFGMLWIFPLLFLLFMAIMMFACRGMRFRCGHGTPGSGGHETARQILDRRYAAGEIDKEQYDAMRRDLNG